MLVLFFLWDSGEKTILSKLRGRCPRKYENNFFKKANFLSGRLKLQIWKQFPKYDDLKYENNVKYENYFPILPKENAFFGKKAS